MDPLKPFTSIIRSLWGRTSRPVEDIPRPAETTSATEHKKATALSTTQPVQTLHGRLRVRMATLTRWDPMRARQLFVECVIVSELGEDLANDPAFTGIVKRVSDQLGGDSHLSTRLDQLLKRLAAGEVIA